MKLMKSMNSVLKKLMIVAVVCIGMWSANIQGASAYNVVYAGMGDGNKIDCKIENVNQTCEIGELNGEASYFIQFEKPDLVNKILFNVKSVEPDKKGELLVSSVSSFETEFCTSGSTLFKEISGTSAQNEEVRRIGFVKVLELKNTKKRPGLKFPNAVRFE